MLKNGIVSLFRLVFPRQCVVCGNTLQEDEEALCLACNMNLPRTGYHLQKDNPVEQMFWAKIPLQRATSFFYYRKGSDFRNLLHLLKYGGRRDLGVMMGQLMASEIRRDRPDFFEGVDVIIPVPLHPRKMRMRGYNQSDYIAKGVSRATAIPVDTKSAYRLKHNDSQTSKPAIDRWQNVEGIFSLHNPETFKDKHILILDDVLTTGATVTACADAFADVEGIKISVLTLCKAE